MKYGTVYPKSKKKRYYRNHISFFRRLNRYEVRRLSIARKAGFKLVSVHQFRKDQYKSEEIEIYLNQPNPYIEVCYSEWESPSSFASHYTNYSGRSSYYDVMKANSIRKEFVKCGISKRAKVYQLYYYSRDDDRSKNDLSNRYVQGRAFFNEVKLMPQYFDLIGAKNQDATLGKPGGLWDENQTSASKLRANIYQRLIPRVNGDTFYESKYGGKLSHKTGYQILKNYRQLLSSKNI